MRWLNALNKNRVCDAAVKKGCPVARRYKATCFKMLADGVSSGGIDHGMGNA